jgi:hypothetical protein
VKVVGGGNGVPGPTVKFPGAYKPTDPSFDFSIYGGIKDYPMPGPAVWTSGSYGGDESTVPAPEDDVEVPDEEETAPTPVPDEEETEPIQTPDEGQTEPPIQVPDETPTNPDENSGNEEPTPTPAANNDGATCKISRRRLAARNRLRALHKRTTVKA